MRRVAAIGPQGAHASRFALPFEKLSRNSAIASRMILAADGLAGIFFPCIRLRAEASCYRKLRMLSRSSNILESDKRSLLRRSFASSSQLLQQSVSEVEIMLPHLSSSADGRRSLSLQYVVI